MRHWLKELRLRKKMTQSQVAQNVGITTQHYNYIENGERNPSPEIAKKIAVILGFKKHWYKLFDNEVPVPEEAAT